MKNLFIIIILVLAVKIKAQYTVIEDSLVIDCSEASDDTAYYDFPNNYASDKFAMEFKIRETLDANDATITYCGSLFADTYNNFSSINYPQIFDQTDNDLVKAIYMDKNPFPYQGIIYIKNSVTDGKIVFRRLMFIPQKR